MITIGKQALSLRRSTPTILLDRQMATKKAVATIKLQKLTVLASALMLTLWVASRMAEHANHH